MEYGAYCIELQKNAIYNALVYNNILYDMQIFQRENKMHINMEFHEHAIRNALVCNK